MRAHFGAPMLAALLFLCAAGARAGELTPATAPTGETALLSQAMARLDARLAAYPDDPEAVLLKGILLFKAGRLAEARDELERLIRREPGFQLAHLVYADLLLAHTRAFQGTPRLIPPDTSLHLLAGLREEAKARLNALLDSLAQDRVPRPLLALDDQVGSAIIVDKASHRLYVYAHAGAGEPPRLVRDFYVSTGKTPGNKRVRGDLRTPEGVYFINAHLPAGWLPEKYGAGAYPIDYPNELDRRLGKTGEGIWLHGTGRPSYSRPPLDSEGCVVLSNPDLLALGGFVKPGVTPVIIAARVQWVTRAQWRRLRREALVAIGQWRAAGENASGKHARTHQASDFGGGEPAGSGRLSEPPLRLDDLSVFAYPQFAGGSRDVMVVNLPRLGLSRDRRLYFTRQSGQWKVLYERAR